MNAIYTKIIEQLTNNQNVFTEAGLLPIRHIDKFRGQYMNPEAHESFETPAVFYKWGANWVDVGGNVQRGDVSVELHVVLDNYHSVAANSSDYAEGMKIDTYYELINTLVHGLSGQKFSALKRTSDQPDDMPTHLIVHIINYKCNYTDATAANVQKYLYVAGENVSLQSTIHKDTQYSIDLT